MMLDSIQRAEASRCCSDLACIVSHSVLESSPLIFWLAVI